MTLREAQADMRHAYLGGATGVFASGLAWLVAAIVALMARPYGAVAALFFGGMLIHPVAILLSKLAGRPGKHRKGNPLAPLALEGTLWMLLVMPLALYLALEWAQYFFIAMLLIVGGRYLTFATLYGTRVYWLLGGVVAASAFALIAVKASVATAAFTGAGIELIFALVIFRVTRREGSGTASEIGV
jgi:hypothetical protein